VTETATPTPLLPVITGGVVGGSTRIFGQGAPDVPCGMLQILSAGVGGTIPSGTDELIGEGCTDAQGNFTSSPGIGLTRSLTPGEMIYAFDEQHGVSGPPMRVQLKAAAPVPLLGEWGKVGLVLLLVGVAALGLRRMM
jgi:hypothetical protein